MMIKFLIFHVNITELLLQRLQRAIAANGEKPLREMVLDCGLVLSMKRDYYFEETVLTMVKAN